MEHFFKNPKGFVSCFKKKDNFNLEERKAAAKKFIAELMILTPQEEEYLNAFEGKEYKPELLFSDEKILNNIKNHPMAVWKMEQRS